MKQQLETQDSELNRKRLKKAPRKLSDSSNNQQLCMVEGEQQRKELPHIPELILEFTITTADLIDLFEEVAEKLNFEMVEKQHLYATAIKKQKKRGVLDVFNCLNWWGHSPNMTAMKVNIINNDKFSRKLKKVFCLKGLIGNNSEMLTFIQQFQRRLEGMSGASNKNTILLDRNEFEDYEFQEQNANPFHLEACSDYLFHKVLSSHHQEEARISKRLQQQLNDYFQSFGNVSESAELLPSPMKNAITITHDVAEDVIKLVKSKSKFDNEAIMPFFRISIEKYVFDKTEPLLKTIYIKKYQDTTKVFAEKRRRIVSSMTAKQIFEEVLLNKDLQLANNLELTGGERPLSEVRKNIPFCELACPYLEKIGFTSNPREKIKHCQIMYAQLKSYFYQRLSKRNELSSMQDIIPVFITVVVFTEVKNFREQLTMILDFIQEEGQEYEGEKRSIINLSESFNYVVRDWKL